MSPVNYFPRSQNALRRCALQTKTREVYMISRRVVGKPNCAGFAAITKTIIYKPRIVVLLELKRRHRRGERERERERESEDCVTTSWIDMELAFCSPPSDDSTDTPSLKREGHLFCGFFEYHSPAPPLPRILLGDRIAAIGEQPSERGK